MFKKLFEAAIISSLIMLATQIVFSFLFYGIIVKLDPSIGKFIAVTCLIIFILLIIYIIYRGSKKLSGVSAKHKVGYILLSFVIYFGAFNILAAPLHYKLMDYLYPNRPFEIPVDEVNDYCDQNPDECSFPIKEVIQK